MISDATEFSIISASPLATDKAIKQELLSAVKFVGAAIALLVLLPLAISISIAWRFDIIY